MNTQTRSLNSDHESTAGMPVWRRVAIALSLAVGLFFTVRATTHPATVNAAPSSTAARAETRSIEDITLGMRVAGRSPLRHETQSPSSITPATWRAIHVTMDHQGTEYRLAFLRSLEWLTEASATPGGTIHLKLPELGVDGPAVVNSIRPCPAIEPDDGSGRMVVTAMQAAIAVSSNRT